MMWQKITAFTLTFLGGLGLGNFVGSRYPPIERHCDCLEVKQDGIEEPTTEPEPEPEEEFKEEVVTNAT